MDAPHGSSDGLGREVDDRALPSSGDHRARGRLATEKAAFEVDIEDEVPVTLAHLEERHARVDPRVVDEDVEATQRVDDARDHLLRLDGPRDVGLHHHGTDAGLADLLHRLLGRRAIIEVIDADIGAVAGEREGDGPPDPLLGAGDERDLSLEPHGSPRPAAAHRYLSLSTSASSSSFGTRSRGLSRTFLYRTTPALSMITYARFAYR